MSERRTITDEELEKLVAEALACPVDIAPPPEFSRSVWRRIDAWEGEKECSLLARFLGRRMWNGEPVVVLAAALGFGALFMGLFLAGAYAVATHSSEFLRVFQVFIGPNVARLRLGVQLAALGGAGGMMLGGLALSEQLFGQRSGHLSGTACGGAAA